MTRPAAATAPACWISKIQKESFRLEGFFFDAQKGAIDDKLNASELPTAINTALAQAKESGQFDGAPGAPGEPGKDYTLTEADKEEIAEMAAELVEVPEGSGGSYTLPVANETKLGGVKPATKTDEMTQAVGVDEHGGLWALPGGGETEWAWGETVLAEGVIPVDTAANTRNDTGLTLGNLKEWDIFGIKLHNPTKNHSAVIGWNNNNQAILMGHNNSSDQRGVFKWVDVKSKLLIPFMMTTENVYFTNGTFQNIINNGQPNAANSNAPSAGIMSTNIRKISYTFGDSKDTDPLVIINSATLTSEFKWAVVGIRKAV